MTTKRKQILKAIAIAGSATMDDLSLSTGVPRKNLHDNVKATIRDDLCERIRDDVTGLPAYKLTPKGRTWLENDKNDDCCVKPQPAVGENTGSKDADPIVDSGGMCADPLPVGNAVCAPPKPDDLPVAAGAGVMAPDYDPREVSFNHLSREQALTDQRAILDAALTASQNEVAGLRQKLNEWSQHGAAFGVLTPSEMAEAILSRNHRIADLESNEQLPFDAPPLRYIIAEDYLLADTEDQANEIAIEMAKTIETDTPVCVFVAQKARELRINWRDA